jgi:hypothetical protein
MTNDLVRHDVNWFDGRRAQRRSAKATKADSDYIEA